MAVETKDEAQAFISAMRLTIEGRVGFKWMVERLSDLAAYVESISAENEQLNAYLDSTGSRAEYDAYSAAHPLTDGPAATEAPETEAPETEHGA